MPQEISFVYHQFSLLATRLSLSRRIILVSRYKRRSIKERTELVLVHLVSYQFIVISILSKQVANLCTLMSLAVLVIYIRYFHIFLAIFKRPMAGHKSFTQFAWLPHLQQHRYAQRNSKNCRAALQIVFLLLTLS